MAAKINAMPVKRIGAIAGDLVPAEAIKALKDLMAAIGSPHMDCRQDGAPLGGGPREAYLSIPALPGSNALTGSCSSAPIRAQKRRSSTRASGRPGSAT